jgi:heptosyltransferase-2
LHEIERNHELICSFTDGKAAKPKLYPSQTDDIAVAKWKQKPFICVAPASVWFTKQFPLDQWVDFLDYLPEKITVMIIGAPGDYDVCELIRRRSRHNLTINLAGQLNFLESASLMKEAAMNYVNDSAPMHFASAVNAPVTAVYCSTIPAFGFGPLSDISHIVEVTEPLSCRPCGLHGKKACPLDHFNCAKLIRNEQLLDTCPPVL